MFLRQQTPVRLAFMCWPLLVLSGCPTDERGLVFGFSASNVGSSTSSGASGAGDGADGGAASDMSTAGEASTPGGQPGVGGAGARGGEPAVSGAGSEQAGSSTVGATSAGGTAGTLGQAGSAGSSGSGGNAASAGSAGSGGSAGSAGSGNQVDSGPCGDLDQNGVQDCDETVAANPRFDANAQGWLADPGVVQSWQSDDARGKAGSGSLQLTYTTGGASSGWALAAAGQCLAAWGGKAYEVGARAKVPAGQTEGHAELSVAIFGNDDCKGSLLTGKTVAFTAQSGSWQVLSGAVTMPAGTRSVLMRLAAAKPGPQPSLEVHFDDVLFREKAK